MTATDKELAQESKLQELNLTAPRVTPEMLDAMIKQTDFTLASCKTVMHCQITLHNGFKLFGVNTCVSAENFKLELAEKYSYEQAREQLWPLAGFLLAEDLHRGICPLSEEQRKLPNHIQRVIIEMFGVAGKLQSLANFLNAYEKNPELYVGIDSAENADLQEQYGHMMAYTKVLQRRLTRAGV